MVPKDASSTTYQKKLHRNGYGSITAIDPHDGKEWDILVSLEATEKIAKFSTGKVLELSDCVVEVLKTPKAVFEGIREWGEDEGWCYVGKPDHAYNYKTGEKTPPWLGQVMVIFVSDDRVLYNWYWCDADKDVPYLPKDHETRFRKKVF